MENLKDLLTQRNDLYRQIEDLGDFRPGLISVNYRRCGKENCVCHQKGHPGHGPQYLWNATRKGKSVAQNLHLGPELEKVRKETQTYKRFVALCQEAIQVNEKICRLRPVPEIKDQEELEELKKKLLRMFFKKPKGRSIA